MDDSWTRINRPIITGTLKRYLYLFYKSVPGERSITSINLSLKEGQQQQPGQDQDKESIDTGIRFKNQNVYVTYKRGPWRRGNRRDRVYAMDNIAILLGSNPMVPYGWNAAAFEHHAHQELPNWDVQLIYRTGNKALPQMAPLRFHQDGSFKIVQFADIHMATGPHSCHQAPVNMPCTGDINTLEMMERMLDMEKPDLVAYTGDNVDGVTSKDALSTILKYSKPVIDRRIPWTIVFGNHDEEGDLSREEMISSVQDLPYSLSQRGPPGISGTGNYHLSIYGYKRGHGYLIKDESSKEEDMFEDMMEEQKEKEDQDEDEDEPIKQVENDTTSKEKSLFTLYFLDSGAYSFSLTYPGWDWIKEDQVEWFRQTSKAITSQYHKNQVPNALAFFHIPIPEYALVEDGHIVGEKNENVSGPSYNSGMFAAFLESKDVRATTVGHDHLNNFCLDHRGINLCFGGGLGYGSYGKPDIPRRSRVFELRKNGDRADTWKRLDNEEMTLVGQQTLYIGKKTSPCTSCSGDDPAGYGSSSSRTRPIRLEEEPVESVTQFRYDL
ncbi:purple acid phosphatase [Modicella reniformis]|uniref:Purple acid phosphatase n=1 Tax=Modicella reniformis TaxID=1440133 RepID=A0A9P6M860_9FUNG|nr:purple acid phosphatase [Modicella reniformis]